MRTVIVAPREIDAASATSFASSLKDPELVVDCSAIEFIDSSGLRVLLEAREVRVSNGGSLVLRSPTDAILRLLEITATDGLFDVEWP